MSESPVLHGEIDDKTSFQCLVFKVRDTRRCMVDKKDLTGSGSGSGTAITILSSRLPLDRFNLARDFTQPTRKSFVWGLSVGIAVEILRTYERACSAEHGME